MVLLSSYLILILYIGFYVGNIIYETAQGTSIPKHREYILSDSTF
jgi:hypothetical protein